MATLEQYMAEATTASSPAKTAIQTQLGALDSNYATGEEKINRNYALQQDTLDRQRNQAARAASINAAATGGSFGGTANLANRKYYEQTFVPAQAQLQTNQANEIDALRQNIENQRTSLNAQLANIESTANQQALQQYWAAQEAERQRQAQAAANASQNAYYSYLMDQMKQNQGNNSGTRAWDFGNGYSLLSGNDNQATYFYNGQQVNPWQFLVGTGSKGVNWDLWKDIWANGVSTKGVGSDTVNAIQGVNPDTMSARYNYLHSL